MCASQKTRTSGCGGNVGGTCWRYVGRLAQRELRGRGKLSRKGPTRREVSAATVEVLESGRDIDCWLDRDYPAATRRKRPNSTSPGACSASAESS